MAKPLLDMSEKAKQVVEYELIHPKASCQEVADACGVKLDTVYQYHNSPCFKEYKSSKLKEKWKDSEALAMQTMTNLAKNGNLNAAKYILDSLGYQAPQKVELDADVKTDVIRVVIEDDA